MSKKQQVQAKPQEPKVKRPSPTSQTNAAVENNLAFSTLPDHATTRPLRQKTLLQYQQHFGNNSLQRFIQHSPMNASIVQRKKQKVSGQSQGKGPGKIKNANEEFYDVSGATLDDITGQLNPFDGHASETYTALTINGQVTPTKNDDDTYQVKVKWKIVDGVVRMPRWTDYAAACPAAKAEWDRFMGLVRQHEQEAHVDVSDKFVKALGEEDTVITGSSIDDLKANLEAKQQELGKRLQGLHDACDHGVGIDAILHPDNGRCEE